MLLLYQHVKLQSLIQKRTDNSNAIEGEGSTAVTHPISNTSSTLQKNWGIFYHIIKLHISTLKLKQLVSPDILYISSCGLLSYPTMKSIVYVSPLPWYMFSPWPFARLLMLINQWTFSVFVDPVQCHFDCRCLWARTYKSHMRLWSSHPAIWHSLEQYWQTLHLQQTISNARSFSS